MSTLRLIVQGSQTPNNVGIVLDGTVLKPYAGCCGEELKRVDIHNVFSGITCQCGVIAMEWNPYNTHCNLNVVSSTVWPQWIAAFTGWPERSIEVDVER